MSLDLHPLSEASGVPFYRQVVDQVTERIRSGQLCAGHPLPSVRELSKTLLVSLITIRRAYADLESAGLVVRRQGRGTFVAEDVTLASQRGARSEAESVLREALGRARGPTSGVESDPEALSIIQGYIDRGWLREFSSLAGAAGERRQEADS